MIKLKNNLFYIFLAFISIITASNAQIYKETNVNYNGRKLYEVATIQRYMKYNPPQPKCVGFEGRSQLQKALYITTNETETNPNEVTKLHPEGMKLNIYCPKVNNGKSAYLQQLPLIVFGYGGGFLNPYRLLNSDKLSAEESVPKWFAERGFVVVVPEYRIGINLFNEELAKRAVYRAVQDIRKVIRLSTKFDQVDYSVNNSEPVTFLGWSSGALIGLHNLYLNENNRTPSTRNTYTINNMRRNWYREGLENVTTYDLGPLNNAYYGYASTADEAAETQSMTDKEVQDITIAVSGAIGSLDWIRNSQIPTNQLAKPKALYLIHHPNDGVVPYNGGLAYEGYSLFKSKSKNQTFNYPFVQGSNIIKQLYETNHDLLKPSIFKFSYLKDGCIGDDLNCINGNAGSEYGPPFSLYKTWYHDPMDKTRNTALMNSIYNFINVLLLNPYNPIPLKAKTVDGNKEEAKELVTTSVDIYPNPVSGDLMNITAIEDGTPYFIYNALGQVVGSGKLENGTIAVAKLSQGTYILKVITKDQDVVKQFIKQ